MALPQHRILLTGSRAWGRVPVRTLAEDYAFFTRILYALGPPGAVLVHGGAEGADTIADRIWTGWGRATHTIRPDYAKHPPKVAPLVRNQEMVDLGGYSICLAFPLGPSRGTRDCIERARAAGIPVLTVS